MLIYDALKRDHEVVRSLLNELIAMDPNAEDKEALIKQIRDELIPHARAEEAVFYNSLRSIDAAKDIIMHAYQEHIEAETLLRTLQAKNLVHADWKGAAEKLKMALEEHIAEEEGRVFNVAKQLFTQQEAEVFGEAFEKVKMEVKEEGMFGRTMDLIENLIPPRFLSAFRKRDRQAGLNR